MIGSKNGQAVFETTSILNETTNPVVYKIDHAVISSTRTAHVMFVEANFPSIGVKPLLGPSNVEVNKGNVEEKREGRIAFSQEVHRSINTPKGMHLFFEQVVRGRPIHPLEEMPWAMPGCTSLRWWYC